MAWKDLYHNIAVVDLQVPKDITSDASSTMVDLQGYNSALFVISVGCIQGTSHAFKLQESDTRVNADFSDVATADLLGTRITTVTKGGMDSSYKIGYIGNKRYVRVDIDESSITQAPLSILALLGAARHAPATTDAIAGTTLTS